MVILRQKTTYCFQWISAIALFITNGWFEHVTSNNMNECGNYNVKKWYNKRLSSYETAMFRFLMKKNDFSKVFFLRQNTTICFKAKKIMASQCPYVQVSVRKEFSIADLDLEEFHTFHLSPWQIGILEFLVKNNCRFFNISRREKGVSTNGLF